MRAVRILAGTLAAAALLLLSLPWWIGWFIFRPEPLESADPRRWRVPAEEVAFAAADGGRLSAWWVPPPDGRAAVVLLVHGRSGNIATRADIARRLAAEGFGLLAFDYRGYGASGGSPGERAIAEDAVSAYDWLLARGVPPGRIAVIGQSLGNAPAARLAATREVAALVLVSPFTSLPGAAAERVPWLPLGRIPWPRNRFDVAGPLRRAQAPVLLVVSRRDALVPYADARRLAASLPRPPHWIEHRGHGHDGLLQAALAEGRIQVFVRAATRRSDMN